MQHLTYGSTRIHYEQRVCVICLSEFQTEDTIYLLQCNHVFHVECLGVYMDTMTTCPVCRLAIAIPSTELVPLDEVQSEEPPEAELTFQTLTRNQRFYHLHTAVAEYGETRDNDVYDEEFVDYEEEEETAPDSVTAKANGEAAKKFLEGIAITRTRSITWAKVCPIDSFGLGCGKSRQLLFPHYLNNDVAKEAEDFSTQDWLLGIHKIRVIGDMLVEMLTFMIFNLYVTRLLNVNQISGPLPDELGNLSSLRMFQVDQNKISGPIPISLANLPNVVHFNMNNNSVVRFHRSFLKKCNSYPSREDNDFDCVDIYKQPALSHPLLKNHKIQIKDQVNVESEGCPSGKVPIQRTRSDRQFGHQFSKDFPDQHLHFATIDTMKNTTYHGATAGICIYEPRVQSNQYSMAQIWVQSGPIAELNSIQAGWAADEFKNTGCYNAQCPGYVQVHPHLRPGGLFEHTSVPGGTQYGFEVRIIQEQSSGNWWLITNAIRIGYWPKELFNHLGNGASVVRYGGTTSSPQGRSSPPMGNGKLPSGKSPFTAGFFQQVKLMDSNYKMIDLAASDIRGNIDAPRTCYDLFFFQIIASRGYVFGYGGPGGPSFQAISKQSDPAILNDQLHHFSVLPSREDNDFDCVDIYKQPALSHPLLKNHKIQMKGKVNVESEGCPSGKFATIDTMKNTTYHGAIAGIYIYEPRVQSNQYSMAQIWVQSGPIAELNSIQAGWAADGFKNTGCYNAQCPGYVQVHPHLRPGGLFEHTSVPGGTQYGFEVRIIQEQSSGNWWLITNAIRIGYWPKELFNHLGNGASVVRYGGTTSSPQGHSSPPMGNGKLPSGESPFTAGFFQQVKLMDSNYKVIDLAASDIRGNIDAPRTCYDLFFFQIIASRGYVFGYGGPGGPSCNT
ncbi:hypothetical protein FNV43_RR10235 [Rhamnella rubrinervis]|uniref:RING-type domain-containing protein n=1 Tax=Rhamnella rubrinervis TaxID=2594499 RepID=A0A8K0HBG5_9ROSA|nr:hypothetical protein FNV43_RR10235 [Rhamnella rubrinervis]